MSSRRKEFTSPQYVKDAITAAYSTTYNPRNVEEPFYTPFCETMSKLAELSPDPLGGTLSGRQQHNLTCSLKVVNLEELPEDEARNVHPDGYSDDEDQGGIGARVAKRRRLNVIESPEGAVPVHLVQNALVSFRNLDQDDLDHVDEPDSDGEPGDEDGAGNVGEVNEDDDLGLHNTMGNISATTAATVPGGEVSLPDVVLCHTRVINMKKPSDPDALVAWEARLGNKVAHQCFPVIGEIKRAPSRPLRGRKHELQRDRNLFDAVDDLVYYMSVNFNHDPHAKSVIGIVAAGAWWKWRRIKRSEVPPPSFWDEDEPVSAEENRWRNMKYKVSTKYLTAPVNYLGTKQSDQEWDKLRRTALAQILKAHETDYP